MSVRTRTVVGAWRRFLERMNQRNRPTGPILVAPKIKTSVMTGQYLSLYKYLDGRYADTVVLTFEQIEALLGFALPDRARRSEDWWTHPDPGRPRPSYSDSWTLASRTAKPNLMALTVIFDRAS